MEKEEETITIPISKYDELLITKGKYEELNTAIRDVANKDFNKDWLPTKTSVSPLTTGTYI